MAALIKGPVVSGETVLPVGARPAAATAAPASRTVAEPAPPAFGKEMGGGDVSAAPRHGGGVPVEPVFTPPSVSAVPKEDAEALRARLAREHDEALASIREEARRQGFDEGVAKGEAEGRKRLDEAAESLRCLVDSANATVAETFAEAEEVIGAIVFEAVCRIVGEKLVTTEGVRAVVAHLVARARRDEVVAIRVSPDDRARLAGLADSDGVLTGLSIEEDSGIELGGCIVQLKGGHLDGRIETQFRAFAQSIKDAAVRRD